MNGDFSLWEPPHSWTSFNQLGAWRFQQRGNLETVRIFHLGSYVLCHKKRGEGLFNWNIDFNHFGQHGVVSNLIICFGRTLINFFEAFKDFISNHYLCQKNPNRVNTNMQSWWHMKITCLCKAATSTPSLLTPLHHLNCI